MFGGLEFWRDMKVIHSAAVATYTPKHEPEKIQLRIIDNEDRAAVPYSFMD